MGLEIDSNTVCIDIICFISDALFLTDSHNFKIYLLDSKEIYTYNEFKRVYLQLL